MRNVSRHHIRRNRLKLNSISFYNLLVLVVPIILTTIFTYLYNVRKDKHFRFLDGLESSLDAVICPIYHDILRIKKIQNAEKYEGALVEFFTKYSLPDSRIYKLGDFFTLQRFYEVMELYDIFCSKREDEAWRRFHYKFDSFSDIIKNLYFDSFTVLYRDFYWHRKTHSTNFFIKIYYEIIKIIYEFLKFTIVVLLLFYYFLAFAKITKSIDVSFVYPYMELIVIYSGVIFILFSLAMMLNTSYLSSLSMQSRERFLRKFLSKRFPNLMEFLEEFPAFEYKKYKNFPRKSEKRFFDVG